MRMRTQMMRMSVDHVKKRRYVAYIWSSFTSILTYQTTASEEEKVQAVIILDLERCHRCNDKQCSKTPCYVAGPEAEHIHLTHMHLRMWAAAIVALTCGLVLLNIANICS